MGAGKAHLQRRPRVSFSWTGSGGGCLPNSRRVVCRYKHFRRSLGFPGQNTDFTPISPCISGDAVCVFFGGACGLSRCSNYRTQTPSTLKERPPSRRAALEFDVGQIYHTWGMSSLNEHRPSANAKCNLISAGSQTEKKTWGRCRRDENDKNKPFPLLFFFLLLRSCQLQPVGCFISASRRARTAFTVLTVARCASAGMVPAATTSQEPACAPPAGQDHTAFWVMEATSLKRGVREALSGSPSRHPPLANATATCL